MKRVLGFSLAGIVILLAAGMTAAAQSQSSPLGDYARATKKNKPGAKTPARVYDNDNLPGNSALSVVGNTSQGAGDHSQDKDAGPKATADDKSDDKKKAENPDQIKPGQSPEDRQKAFDGWKQKIDAQKDKVSLLSRELDLVQGEYRLRVATYYADPSNRVRGAADWETQNAKDKERIADKQKALDDAKTALNALLAQAHKAGVPNAITE